MYGERLCNLQYTDALRGSEVTVGGGCGPSGPSSSTATHLYCAPFSAFVGVTTKMEDTWTGEEDVRSVKEWLYTSVCPLYHLSVRY